MTSPADRLIDLLDPEQSELNIFRGRGPDESLPGVFGSRITGQALVACGRTTVTPAGLLVRRRNDRS